MDIASVEELPNCPTGDMPMAIEGGKDNQSWVKCMMGCEIDGTKEVTKLDCLHFLCSDACNEKLKNGVKPGEDLRCIPCGRSISTEQLSVKITPADMFVKKKTAEDVEIACDICIFDRPAVAFCPICPCRLCLPCKELHPQLKKSATHKLEDDLTQIKIQTLQKVLEEESKCKVHNKHGDTFCRPCNLRICELCVDSHEDHETVHVEAVKEGLRCKIANAKRLAKQFEKATVEIGKKKEEIQTSELEKTMKMISDHFAMLMRELAEREEKVKAETKEEMTKLVEKLDKRIKFSEFSKASHERFARIGEKIINEGADVASVNFMMLHENYLKDVEAKGAWFTANFDKVLERGKRFELNDEEVSKAKELASKFGRIYYKYKPGGDGAEAMDEAQVATVGLGGGSAGSVGSSIPATVEQSTSEAVNVVSISSNDNAIESSVSSGQGSVGKDKPLKKRALQEAACEDSLKTVENGKPALKSGLVGSIDKGVGNGDGVGVGHGLRRKNSCGRQCAVKSTGSAQGTARGAKRSKTLAIEHQIEPEEELQIVVGKRDMGNQASTNGCKRTRAASTNGDVQMEMDESISNKCVENAKEIKPEEEQGRGKRRRKANEHPNYVYTHKIPKQSKAKIAGEIEASVDGDESFISNCSQLFIIENYDLTEDGDEMAAELQENGEDDDSEDGCGDEDDDDDEPVAGPSVSSCCRIRPYVRLGNKTTKVPRIPVTLPSYPLSHSPSMIEAPVSTLETLPSAADYPLLNKSRMKIWREGGSDNFCGICLDQDGEAMVCCDYCARCFHLKCHLPVLEVEPGLEKWKCPFQTDKDTLIANIPDIPGSADAPLDETNRRQFLLACDFVMKIYNFPESPTIRFIFPDGYCDMFGKVPFNLKYIRGRLGEGKPEPFAGVEDMLLAFKQLFKQSSIYYRQIRKEEYRKEAENCFLRFLELVYAYYPSYGHLFGGIEFF